MSTKGSRQELLHQTLLQSPDPVTGTELSARLRVTRQVVVHDIALLRAQGVPIVATPRGYWIVQPRDTLQQFVVSVTHPPELTAVELLTFVDFGIRVLDVVVEHGLYGEIRGSLHLSSRRDVELFLSQWQSSNAPLLSSLTDGQHLHTVASPDERRLMEAIAALREHGVQVLE